MVKTNKNLNLSIIISFVIIFLGCSMHPKKGDIYKSKINPERRIRIVFINKEDSSVAYEVVSKSEVDLDGEEKKVYNAMKESIDKLPGYPSMKSKS